VGFLSKSRSVARTVREDHTKAAYVAMAEELFQDYYAHRRQVYKMNFVRGIFLGFGTVIGGTVVVALLIWILSFFMNVPVIGNFFKDTRQTIQER